MHCRVLNDILAIASGVPGTYDRGTVLLAATAVNSMLLMQIVAQQWHLMFVIGLAPSPTTGWNGSCSLMLPRWCSIHGRQTKSIVEWSWRLALHGGRGSRGRTCPLQQAVVALGIARR